MTKDELVELEEQGWLALSTGGPAAREFYGRIVDPAVVMLLPGGMVLDDPAVVLESMSGRPWTSYALEPIRVVRPTPDTAIVAYGVVAHRDASRYSALVSSTYVRRPDGWRLTFHQQTQR